MPPKAYEFVPMVDFSKEWDDEKLYGYFSLNADEVNHIKSTMRNME
jgi:site-specific DNA-methyltransferase (adenine-specific)